MSNSVIYSSASPIFTHSSGDILRAGLVIKNLEEIHMG
ncbi:hypothetical protein Zm00014a_040055 [Zea mays]|uniref:Uncharacterized protein n=1 Tax=Zea mays TaxID=4577 RepID=A0A3L6E7T8_MAIZE|nr:hypothetical protein Zm00014a_040055 [Zea mays]